MAGLLRTRRIWRRPRDFGGPFGHRDLVDPRLLAAELLENPFTICADSGISPEFEMWAAGSILEFTI
jgi:hypothetical protein